MEVIDSASLEHFPSSKIIFKDKQSEENVFIIINGVIQVKDHSCAIETPKTQSQLSEGDIINPGDLDGNQQNNYQIWFKCETPVEYIMMRRNIFQSFWKAQTSFGKETLYLIIKRIPLFQCVSEVTMHKMVYELLKIETYDANHQVYNDLSYYEETQKNTKKKLSSLTQNADQQDVITQQLHLRKKNQRAGLQSYNQNALNQITDKKKNKTQRGVFFVLEGQCGVFTHEGNLIHELSKSFFFHKIDIGGFFGENLLIPVKKSITNFGYIMTLRKNTRLGLISKNEFDAIPQYDVRFFCCKNVDYGYEEVLCEQARFVEG